MPKLGIALAAYKPNATHFEEQLRSISNQTFSDWVCVVSFDSDPAALPEPFLRDPRFIVVRNNTPPGHKQNFIFACKELLRLYPGLGFIAFCDQDDVWLPFKIEKMLQALENSPPYSLVHSDLSLYFGAAEATTSVWKYEGRKVLDLDLDHLFIRNLCTGAAMVLATKLVRDFIQIPDAFKDHDHWFALIASSKGRIIPLTEALVLYRQHGQNLIGAHSEPHGLKLRRQRRLKELARHCVSELNQFEKKVNTFPLEVHGASHLLRFTTKLKILFKAYRAKDRILFRRVLLLIIGQLLRPISKWATS